MLRTSSQILLRDVQAKDPYDVLLAKLRYHDSINDAVADHGVDIGEAFTGSQKYLYQGMA